MAWSVAVLLHQTQALLRKQLLLAGRIWKPTAAQLLAPFVVCFISFLLELLAEDVLGQSDPHPVQKPIVQLSPCTWTPTCRRLMYAPAGVPWVDGLMADVARANHLGPDDLEGLRLPKCKEARDCVRKMNQTLYPTFLANPMMAQNVVVFLAAFVSNVNRTTGIPNDVGYWLWFNQTADKRLAMETRVAVDNAILRRQTGKPDAAIEVSLSSFPKPPWRNARVDFPAGSGGIWYYIPLMIIFFFLMMELVAEKEQRQRVGMEVMGLYRSAYWLSWIIYAAMMLTASTFIIQASGLLFRFSFFKNSNPLVIFLLFELYGASVAAAAFLLSTLIPTTRTAQTIGFGMVLGGFVFQGIISGDYALLIHILDAPRLSLSERIMKNVLNFYPPYHFAKAYYGITALSSDTMIDDELVMGVGFTWSDLFVRRQHKIPFMNLTVYPEPLLHSFFWLLGNMFLYALLALYLDLAQHYGLLWPLSGAFWGCRSHAVPQAAAALRTDEFGDEDVRQEKDAVDAATEDVIADKALLVSHVGKIYQSGGCGFARRVEAVTDLCLRVEKNEIFGFIGHNGAGKTTLLSLLSGALPATSGEAFIFGHNITHSRSMVQKLTGLCAQQDALWPDLTAYEHLALFAVLKGMSPENAAQDIARKLQLTGLADVQHINVGAYSGGMKRRLSVAISALGDPPVLFMDEPTTGLDPVHRREVWKLIQSMKQHHSIVLATHSMEEADALCDRIGIMAQGHLCCFGDTMHLKEKYGSGYSLEVTCSNFGAEGDQVVHKVRDMFPDTAACQLVSREGANLTFSIGPSSNDVLRCLLEMLEEETARSLAMTKDGPNLIREWRLEHTSLEEVFFRVMALNRYVYDTSRDAVVTHAEGPKPNGTSYGATEDVSSPTAPVDDAEGGCEFETQPTFDIASASRPYHALMNKNLSLQSRQLGSLFCQMFSPVAVVIFLVLLQMIVRDEAEAGSIEDRIYLKTSPISVNPVPPVQTAPPKRHRRGSAGPRRATRGPTASGSPLMKGIQSRGKMKGGPGQEGGKAAEAQNVTREVASNCLLFFAATDLKSDGRAGRLADDGQQTGFLRHIPQGPCLVFPNETAEAPVLLQVPHFRFHPTSYKKLERAVYRDVASLKNKTWDDIKEPPLENLLPDALVDFRTVRPEEGKLRYNAAVNDNVYILYHRANNFTRLSSDITGLNLHNSALFETDLLTPDLARFKLLTWLNQAFIREAAGLKPLTKMGRLLASNYVQAFPDYIAVDAPSIVEMVGTLLYPLALTVQLPIYMYLIVMEKEDGLFYLVRSMGMPTHTYITGTCAFFAGMYVLVCGSFWTAGLLAQLRFFLQTDAWVLLAFFAGWGLALIALAFFLTSMTGRKRTAVVVGYSVALIGTMMGLVMGAIVYGHSALNQNPRLPAPLLLNPQWAWSRAIYLLNYACTQGGGCYRSFRALSPELVRCLVALYCDALLCFVGALVIGWRSGRSDTDSVPPEDIADEKDMEEQAGMAPSCAEEHRRVVQHDYPAGSPLVIRSLSKTYENGTKALEGLSLIVEENQCLGYLGPNGSGKTTTMGILSGVLHPTLGTAWIGGQDIRSQPRLARLLSGVCPQFSILWDDLTVLEHMLFYARLKGVPKADELRHARQLLRSVGLSHLAGTQAEQLSGGMQRRLSIAIAFCGSPRIVFLDEPTTGLDPLSRKELWRVLLRARRHRAMLLTTHAMEEAQLLCTRIAVLLGGRLQCIGTQQQLLDQLGIGYQLTVRFDVAQEAAVLAFLNAAIPSAEVAYHWRHVMTFWLPPAVRPSEVISIMSVNPPPGLLNWSVSHVGLDELFASIVDKNRQAAFAT
eukprot:EG_transcript_155